LFNEHSIARFEINETNEDILDNNSIYSLLLHRAILHSLRVRRKDFKKFPFVLPSLSTKFKAKLHKN